MVLLLAICARKTDLSAQGLPIHCAAIYCSEPEAVAVCMYRNEVPSSHP